MLEQSSVGKIMNITKKYCSISFRYNYIVFYLTSIINDIIHFSSIVSVFIIIVNHLVRSEYIIKIYAILLFNNIY